MKIDMNSMYKSTREVFKILHMETKRYQKKEL